MKNTIIKIDRFILDQLTVYVRRWMAKHDYEKHKVDFLIQLEKYNFIALLILAMAIPTGILFIEREFLSAGIQAIMWSILGTMGYFLRERTTRDSKEFYDNVYSLRKEPAFTFMYKEVLENLFIENQENRIKTSIFMLTIDIFVACLLFVLSYATNFQNPSNIVAIYILINSFVSLVGRYIGYVFDMDEPAQKKETKESITDIVRQEWEQFIGGLSPTPTFI